MLDVEYKLKGKIFKIDEFWLRDHCKCVECYNKDTNQRRLNLLDIPPSVHPLQMHYNNNELIVKWSDNHYSKYDLNFLYGSQLTQLITLSTKSLTRTTWNREMILKNEQNLHFSLPFLISNDSCVKSVVETLVRYGIVFIDQVPPTTTMTEMAVRRIFPIMKTFFGEMYTFSDQKDHDDTAYSKQYIGVHTDNTYFCDAAGLQALHCIAHINGEGGENIFVDGLHAALELKKRYPKAFKLLTTVQVPGEYIEKGEHHKHDAPIIRIDPITGEILQLRFNLYDRAVFNTIKQEEMQQFYDSFRKFIQIIHNDDNQWIFKLQPGTIILFDNWRTLHGRYAYTGQRIMTGCYIQRTDYISKARILGIFN